MIEEKIELVEKKKMYLKNIPKQSLGSAKLGSKKAKAVAERTPWKESVLYAHAPSL